MWKQSLVFQHVFVPQIPRLGLNPVDLQAYTRLGGLFSDLGSSRRSRRSFTVARPSLENDSTPEAPASGEAPVVAAAGGLAVAERTDIGRVLDVELRSEVEKSYLSVRPSPQCLPQNCNNNCCRRLQTLNSCLANWGRMSTNICEVKDCCSQLMFSVCHAVRNVSHCWEGTARRAGWTQARPSPHPVRHV